MHFCVIVKEVLYQIWSFNVISHENELVLHGIDDWLLSYVPYVGDYLLSQQPEIGTSMFQVENVIFQLNKTFPADGLLPIYLDPNTGTSQSYSTITFGAMGDRYQLSSTLACFM